MENTIFENNFELNKAHRDSIFKSKGNRTNHHKGDIGHKLASLLEVKIKSVESYQNQITAYNNLITDINSNNQAANADRLKAIAFVKKRDALQKQLDSLHSEIKSIENNYKPDSEFKI